MFAGVSSNIPLLLIASEMYVKCDMALIIFEGKHVDLVHAKP
jgi:hypothetical protein